MHLVDPAHSTFTTSELERLAAYRAAVAAGFYTDWDGSAESTDTRMLAELQSTAGPAEDATYPFTTGERQRLERCRQAVAAGYYSEDQPPTDAAATSEEQTR
jgi:hypothetical protein